MRKNAQMGSLQGIILTLVVIGILLGVGFLIFQNLMETTSVDDQYTITDETLTAVLTDAGVYPAHNYTTTEDCRGNQYTLTGVVNGTGADAQARVVVAGNTSMDGVTGKITNLTSEYVDATLLVNYTYYSGGVACKGVESVSSATTNITTYLPIIVIILIVGIILVIVFAVMPSMGRGGGGGTTAEI